MLEAIRAPRVDVGGDIAAASEVDGGAGASFASTMKQAVANVDGQQHAASDKVTAVESGQSDDLIGAMLSSQQASLSFSMMMQVRNKLMAAFDDIIKMQV